MSNSNTQISTTDRLREIASDIDGTAGFDLLCIAGAVDSLVNTVETYFADDTKYQEQYIINRRARLYRIAIQNVRDTGS